MLFHGYLFDVTAAAGACFQVNIVKHDWQSAFWHVSLVIAAAGNAECSQNTSHLYNRSCLYIYIYIEICGFLISFRNIQRKQLPPKQFGVVGRGYSTLFSFQSLGWCVATHGFGCSNPQLLALWIWWDMAVFVVRNISAVRNVSAIIYLCIYIYLPWYDCSTISAMIYLP